MKQIILKATGCSGRGVKFRELDTDERANILDIAFDAVGKEATMLQLQVREGLEGVFAMVQEVTEKAGFKTQSDLLAADVKWKKVTNEHLSEQYKSYFNTKDMDALVKIFRTVHDVSNKEVEDILGEALPVAVD